jgi:enoyl-CoA hydratase/carnithine racemase
VDLQSQDGVAVLRFPEEPLYPRLATAVLRELSDLLVSLSRERVFRGVVIASNPFSFPVGADLPEIASLDAVRGQAFSHTGQAVCRQIRLFPSPVVAAIRGFCFGGGLDLALACHSRVASYDASFSHPGATLGVIPGWGGTQCLPRKFGKAAALEILLTAQHIPATQAMSLGLADELVSSQDLIGAAVARVHSRRSRRE